MTREEGTQLRVHLSYSPNPSSEALAIVMEAEETAQALQTHSHARHPAKDLQLAHNDRGISSGRTEGG